MQTAYRQQIPVALMLTDASIRAAIRAGGNKTLTDGGKRGSGRLLLTLRPDIRPEWYACTWLQGRKRMVKIGTFPELSLADAREQFKTTTFDRPAKAASLATLIEDYTAHLDAQGKRSTPDIRRTLNRMAEVIGRDRPANQVTTADIVEVLRPVYAAGKASMADHMRGSIRAAYGWAMKAQNDYRAQTTDRFQITANPALLIPTEPKTPGERYLSRDELFLFWNWLGRGTMHENRNTDPRNLVALRLLILSGQRVEEILRLRREWVRDGIIEWPETKTGNRHVLPATPRMLRMMTWCKAIGTGTYFDSDPHVIRSVCKSFCKQTGVADFTTRDLRRTWKTLAGVAGISKTDRDLIQNHSNQDVSSRHYDRYDYLPEKLAALERWESWLLAAIKKAPE